MKTLADLKRDLVIGTPVILKEFWGKTTGKNVGVIRYVVSKNTANFSLSEDKNAKKGSFCDWPKASLLEYDGKIIKIFSSGTRLFTQEEKQIYLNKPRDDKQMEIDALTDGSTMYWREKSYFQSKKGFMHLFGVSRERGMSLKYGTKETMEDGTFSDWSINDESIKGDVGLLYEIVK